MLPKLELKKVVYPKNSVTYILSHIQIEKLWGLNNSIVNRGILFACVWLGSDPWHMVPKTCQEKSLNTELEIDSEHCQELPQKSNQETFN